MNRTPTTTTGRLDIHSSILDVVSADWREAATSRLFLSIVRPGLSALVFFIFSLDLSKGDLMSRITKWERLLARLIEARKNLEELSRLNREALGKETS